MRLTPLVMPRSQHRATSCHVDDCALLVSMRGRTTRGSVHPSHSTRCNAIIEPCSSPIMDLGLPTTTTVVMWTTSGTDDRIRLLQNLFSSPIFWAPNISTLGNISFSLRNTLLRTGAHCYLAREINLGYASLLLQLGFSEHRPRRRR